MAPKRIVKKPSDKQGALVLYSFALPRGDATVLHTDLELAEKAVVADLFHQYEDGGMPLFDLTDNLEEMSRIEAEQIELSSKNIGEVVWKED